MEWTGSLDTLRRLLRIAYGQPRTVDTGLALRLFGLRDRIHPKDAYACRCDTERSAQGWIRADREILHHHVVGPMMTEVGWVYLVDLRGAKFRLDVPWTDPEEPD